MASIEKRIGKDDRVCYRITVAAGIGLDGRQIRRRRLWKPSKENMSERQIEKELARAVSDFEREVEQGYRPDENRTFAEYAEYVINLKSYAGAKLRTIERYRALLTRINMAIGHMKLSRIRPQHLNAFYRNLSEEGVRSSTVKAVSKMDIRAWLGKNGIAITSFAKRAGCATATIESAMRGQRVSGEKAEAISEVMGLSVDDVFTLSRDTTPLSNKTVLEYHRLISTILAQAEKEMLIPYNPAAKATPPKAEKKTPDYYQPEVMAQILDALDGVPLKWKALTYLLIDTGCRRGEAAGLKWEDVDLDSGVITIARSLLYSSTHGTYESTTKTGVIRSMKLAPETIAVLTAWRREYEQMRETAGELWVNTGYVFVRNDGDMMNPGSITSWLNVFGGKNGLPHIHPHAFRHTAASTMIANGVDLVTTANELGHANATTTATIYAHQISAAKANAESVRAGVFNRKKGF